MTCLSRLLIPSLVTIQVYSFTLYPITNHGMKYRPHTKVNVDATGSSSSRSSSSSSSSSESEEQEPPSLLILGDAMKQELSKFRSKYPTSESDYLAAARKRSEEKPGWPCPRPNNPRVSSLTIGNNPWWKLEMPIHRYSYLLYLRMTTTIRKMEKNLNCYYFNSHPGIRIRKTKTLYHETFSYTHCYHTVLQKFTSCDSK
jgi:hypothetical protein